MDGKTAQRLAAKIANEIMTCGDREGTKADQLRLILGDRYLSGWGEAPLARYIEKILLEEPTPKTTK